MAKLPIFSMSLSLKKKGGVVNGAICGDAADKNLPANAGDMGSIPGQKEDSTCHGATKPAHHNFWSLPTPGPLLCNNRSHHSEKPVHHSEE